MVTANFLAFLAGILSWDVCSFPVRKDPARLSWRSSAMAFGAAAMVPPSRDRASGAPQRPAHHDRWSHVSGIQNHFPRGLQCSAGNGRVYSLSFPSGQ